MVIGISYRIVEVSLLVEVSKTPVDDGTHGAARTRTCRHQPTVHGIGHIGWARYEHHGALWQRVDLSFMGSE